ncbi:MAG: 50S ribosomal protein L2, partial [Candidatus Moranbacteria bacterium]|nr:50S ribosomal protein L2 [Candidatus Moranbacteria bacterium]
MLKQAKPTTSGRRNRVDVKTTDIHAGRPEKSLLKKGHLKRQGRGFKGHITVRHRGGGVKKLYRKIDFKRDKTNVEGVIKQIEYDPNRSSFIALVFYTDGEKRYVLAPEGLKAGDRIVNHDKAEAKIGNTMAMRNIPLGVPIHNLELQPGRGAKLVRSAGVGAIIQSKDEKFATILLPSKEVRLFKLDCLATVGQIGNQDHKNEKLGKAGRKRLMGIRPGVRGTAQHPGSHPHGGGEGRSGIGMPHPKTPWGKPDLGHKTRKSSKNRK